MRGGRSLTGRERLGLGLSGLASRASRTLGKGSGGVIGSRVALRVAPSVLASLAGGRSSVLVTGTNGKSTVTALLDAVLATRESVVSNRTGANMPDGILTALAADRSSPSAALEVDEVYLGPVVRDTHPRAIVVLNASREYTRGVSVGHMLDHWRSVAATLGPATTVIANVDDPLVQWAFEDVPSLVAVAGRLVWQGDAHQCNHCGGRILGLGSEDGWACDGCGWSRRQPLWSAGAVRRRPDGRQVCSIQGPGGSALVSVGIPTPTAPAAAMAALAAGEACGIPLSAGERAIEEVIDFDGRYVPFHLDGRLARIMMLKNPAGWADAIEAARSSLSPLVVAVAPFGPRDLTTLWEAPWARLVGHQVVVAGARAEDASAALSAHGVDHVVVDDPLAAVVSMPPGEVLLGCNYPAFRATVATLRSLDGRR